MKKRMFTIALTVILLTVGSTLIFMSFQIHPKATYSQSLDNHPFEVKAVPDYLRSSLEWLASAQYENGAWGAGLHSAQGITDPKAVPVDPATTAFSAMAFLRVGNTLQQGPYRSNLKKALDFLLTAVDETPPNSINITTATGTQPQRKLGQNIDVAMTAQFFARILKYGELTEAQKSKVNTALDKCIAMLEGSQLENGSWNTAGWAPVLNSAMANNALEVSKKVGREVSTEVLDRSARYQESNTDSESGTVDVGSAAGIELYAWSSVQRITAEDARMVQDYIEEATTVDIPERPAGGPPPPPPPPPVIEDILMKSGEFTLEKAKEAAQSYTKNKTAAAAMQKEEVLSGFGNNGGEEYLSYMMTSEAYITTADQEGWNSWHEKMNARFEKVQNADGSWSGHHCITSPVFCTAAVIMTLTADRDQQLLASE